MTEERGRLERWFARHEKTIAAVSGVATAFGLVFAALSAIASYEQLQLINRERMTPYRAILYTAKLDSYKHFISVTNKFIDDAQDHNTAMFVAGEKYGLDSPQVRTAAKAVQDDHEKLRLELEQDRAVWSPALGQRLLLVRAKAGALTECAFIVTGEKSHNRDLGIRNICHPDSMQWFDKDFLDTTFQVTNELRKDIRSDDLQDLRPN